jgi:hypothetical protein
MFYLVCASYTFEETFDFLPYFRGTLEDCKRFDEALGSGEYRMIVSSTEELLTKIIFELIGPKMVSECKINRLAEVFDAVRNEKPEKLRDKFLSKAHQNLSDESFQIFLKHFSWMDDAVNCLKNDRLENQTYYHDATHADFFAGLPKANQNTIIELNTKDWFLVQVYCREPANVSIQVVFKGSREMCRFLEGLPFEEEEIHYIAEKDTAHVLWRVIEKVLIEKSKFKHIYAKVPREPDFKNFNDFLWKFHTDLILAAGEDGAEFSLELRWLVNMFRLELFEDLKKIIYPLEKILQNPRSSVNQGTKTAALAVLTMI